MNEDVNVRPVCEAPHPARKKFPRFEGRTHGAALPVSMPSWFRIVMVRHLDSIEQVRPGYYGVECVCGVVTEFRVEAGQ